jgi:selenocysteine-specific elongation factor
MANYYIVGTAGHIDHGKSALVEKLTGINPDRLIEEQKRGITLDLGFSYLDYEDLSISFVDVPGHEKLIKNMVAGATGFDMCLFAVDGREKIKAQTLEHANIIDFLGVKDIVVAITKADLLDSNELVTAMHKIKSFFEGYTFQNIHILSTSIYDEASINNLKQLIISTVKRLKPKDSSGPFLMHLDRKFIVKGFGVVVTGTALKGVVNKNDLLEHLPSLKKVNVKNIQVHNKAVQSASAGSRVAINVAGLSLSELKRGDTLTSPAALTLVDNFYAKVTMFNNMNLQVTIKNNKTYPIFIGTDHFNAKFVFLNNKEIKGGGSVFAKVYLDRSYSPYINEPFIVRGGSPQTTLGGGVVLSISQYNLKKNDIVELLSAIDTENFDLFLDMLFIKENLSIKIPPILQFLPVSEAAFTSLLNKKELVVSGDYMINKKGLKELKETFVKEVERENTMKLSTLRKLLTDLPPEYQLTLEQEIINQLRKAGFNIKGDSITKEQFSPFELQAEALFKKMQKNLDLSNSAIIAKELNVGENTAINYLKYLANKEKIVRLDDRNYIVKEVLQDYLNKIEVIAKKIGYVDVNVLKKHFALSRKFLIGFLEYLDKTGKYINRDNKRYLKNV